VQYQGDIASGASTSPIGRDCDQTLTMVEGLLTVHNLSEVQRKCGVRGRTGLHERESTTNKNQNPVEGGGRAPEARRVGIASLP